MKDWISGEEVTYSYDSLNRLIQAVTTGPEYGLTFSYDGFGNMTSQHAFKGLTFDTNLGYNGLMNRITSAGYGYDANGNLTAMPYLTMAYDTQNRLIEARGSSGPSYKYGYDATGRRIWRSAQYDDSKAYIDYYGPDGNLPSNCWVRMDYFSNTGGCTTETGLFCREARPHAAGT